MRRCKGFGGDLPVFGLDIGPRRRSKVEVIRRVIRMTFEKPFCGFYAGQICEGLI